MPMIINMFSEAEYGLLVTGTVYLCSISFWNNGNPRIIIEWLQKNK